MSTTFTLKEQVVPQLGQLLMRAHQWGTSSLLNLMAARGHTKLTSAHLMFLNSLDCGVTHASEVARRLGVSRQAVYRSTRELQKLKILKLEIDPERKTQKIIRMTVHGASVIADARKCLGEIEVALRSRLGTAEFNQLSLILSHDWGSPLS